MYYAAGDEERDDLDDYERFAKCVTESRPYLERVAASTDQVSDAKNPLSGCLRKRILEELDRQTVVQLPSVGGYQIVTVFFE